MQQIIVEGNYAPYNFFPAITDTLIPIWLLGLLYVYRCAGGLEGKLRRETWEPFRASSKQDTGTSQTAGGSTP